jgi:hypothetical protein
MVGNRSEAQIVGSRMSEEARRFHRHAFDCRQLAEKARDQRDAALLRDIADDLDAEAERIATECRAIGK